MIGGFIWGVISGILADLKGIWEKMQLRNRITKARERGGVWRRKYYKQQQQSRKEKAESGIKEIKEKLNNAENEDDFENKARNIRF